ncbi:HAMP domain-containing histidine kinase [filamentous cyanobacterium LEGE 11480]|uniref:histidine kinase n=1 Tax=Romeriopsis navalis LEGE 11480 TaxID=2777977 RepID=A0A928Z304_9CYAN|nr:HAMP domain-containing histidine kinase [Romeriopsis navalis]MBE9028683.1 HAMP domain-containing histidine kinase [Romeriopsis navalis LEGE 11480]
MFQKILWLKHNPALSKLKNHPNQLVMGTAALTLVLFAPLVWMTSQSYQSFKSIQEREFRLRQLSDQIIYYDEVLTMTTWLKVTTGDKNWEKRYWKVKPKLTKVLAEATTLAAATQIDDNQVKTNEADDKLAELETEVFRLIKQDKRQQAMAILSGREYEKWKEIYVTGSRRRNQKIQQQLEQKVTEFRYQLLASIAITGTSFLLLIPAWSLVLKLLQQYIQDLNQSQAALEATNQNLEGLVDQRSRELTQRNSQLENALDELQDTQAQLVQSAKMSSLGQLVAGIAHEINNPVNFIHGNLKHVGNYSQDLLQVMETYEPGDATAQAKLDELKEEYDFDFVREDLPKILQSMQTGTDRIREIVLSLRNFSRLDEAERKQADVHEGIESTLMILQHNLASNAQKLPITIQKQYSDIPAVICYPGLINQVLMNVISNAIDAIADNQPDCPPTITITTQSTDTHIQISIQDNGIGMDEEQQKSLFNPFFTTKPVGQGTGLGMSISYKIMTEQHQGKIWAKSELGQGTTFWLEIPRNLGMEEASGLS